jgi:polysaccharide pyruvyl transferase WcaK-like protein/glycosyltransferase involved in cell wall biosynthesis
MPGMKDTSTSPIPRIEPVPEGIAQPIWSVMIPTYNSEKWLRQTLESVMAQDRGSERMQIEVVDNCSTEGDPEALTRAVCGKRVTFYRRSKNEGPIANFNACIQRSQGRLIHILHSDDCVLPGFYAEIERLAELYPDMALLATRCFFIDESGVITGVTRRVPELENGGRSVDVLYYETSMQFPGVVIRREFYEAHGGYVPSLVHVCDREMWARAISFKGGVVSSNVLACYRTSAWNETAAVARSGENVRDLLRLAEVFRKQHEGFSLSRARQIAAHTALSQARRFSALNDRDSARRNWQLWVENCSWVDRLTEGLRPWIGRVLGKDQTYQRMVHARINPLARRNGQSGTAPLKPKNNMAKGCKKPKRICFFGHFGSPNFGNEITLQTVLYHLRRLLPETEIACICTEPEALAAAQKIETVPISRTFVKPGRLRTRLARLLRKLFIGLPSEPWRWLDAFKTLKRADTLIIPGTGLVTDAYGLMAWGPYNLFKWSLIARMCRCKVFFVSVGAGPVYTVLGKCFVKSALSLADFRSYRDHASLEYLQGIGFSTNGDRIYPDLVFSLPEAMLPHSGHRERARSVVGLGLMLHASMYGTAGPASVAYSAYLECLVVFVRWLLAHDYDIRLLIGEVTDRDTIQNFEASLKSQLGDYDGGRIIDKPALSVEQLLPQIAATDIVVATRFHNVLLALLLNKPVIAISFHHKCASLMEEMGLSQYCQDINHMNAGRLIEQFQDLARNAENVKALIRRRVEQSRKALDEQYSLIFKDI